MNWHTDILGGSEKIMDDVSNDDRWTPVFLEISGIVWCTFLSQHEVTNKTWQLNQCLGYLTAS